MNVLLLTSCNRIKQTIFALTLNSYIIQKPFSVIITDCSTPNLSVDDGVKLQKTSDAYNHIESYNYFSDYNIFEDSIKYIKNIIDYKILHFTPWMPKEMGDTIMITLGLSQASLLKNIDNDKNIYCLKLSGSTILKNDILSTLNEILNNVDILVHHFNKDWYSTKIFSCRPNIISKLLIDASYSNWIDNGTKFVEQKFTEIIKSNILNRIHVSENSETQICLNQSGERGNSVREKATEVINKYKIPTNIPIIKEFFEFGVW